MDVNFNEYVIDCENVDEVSPKYVGLILRVTILLIAENKQM